ncbi:MAG: AAA family ATPase, partial [Alphaproteobacteria bacterium]|nr:AAA family ATPase [Alphaproteobacteria bacterium]
YGDLTRPLPLVGGDVDPEAFHAAMLAEFPNMTDAIARITDDLRLRRGAGVPWARFRPLLLVGPAGIGKTRFAKRVARLLGSGYGEVPAGGASDNRMLAGTARGWSTAQPALPLLIMHRSQTANPVILVDEIDKAGGSERNGDLRATLLGLLEMETARAWSDEALLAPCDLSQISWILTANRAEPIAGPLLGRMAVITVRRPPASAFDTILHAILRDLAAELAVEPSMLPELDEQSVEALRTAFVKGTPVRLLKAAVTRALAASETVRVLN